MESCHSVSFPVIGTKRLSNFQVYSDLGHLLKILEQLKVKDSILSHLEHKLGYYSGTCVQVQFDHNISKMAGTFDQQSRICDNDGTKNNYVVKIKEMEQKLKNLQEKNCKFLEKNMELVSSNRNVQDKVKVVTEDYKRLRAQADQARKRVCLLNRQLSQEKLEKESLELKLQEAEYLKRQLSEQTQATAALKKACYEKDRRIELIHHRKRRRKLHKENEMNLGVKETFFGYEEDGHSIDSEASTVSSLSFGSTSDDEICDELSHEEVEKNYQHLMHEHLELQKTYALLQSQLDGCLDPQRENKVKTQLEADLFIASRRIEELENFLKPNDPKESNSSMEQQVFLLSENEALSQKVRYLKNREIQLLDNLRETKETVDNLEFRVTELEECHEKADKVNGVVLEIQKSETDMTEPSEIVLNIEANYIKEIEDLSQQLNSLIKRHNEECEVLAAKTEQLNQAEQKIVNLEQTATELQKKVITSQQEKAFLEEKLHVLQSQQLLGLTDNEENEVLTLKNKIQMSEKSEPNAMEKVARLQIDFETVEQKNQILRKKLSTLEEEIETTDITKNRLHLDQSTQTNIIEIFKATALEKDEKTSTSSTLLLNSEEYDSDISSDVRCDQFGYLQGEFSDLKDCGDGKFLESEMNDVHEREKRSPMERKMENLNSTCDNLQEKVFNAERTEKQLREKLKLAETTINDLESSEGLLQEQCDEFIMREVAFRKQIENLHHNSKELKEINCDKDLNEKRLQEKVEDLEAAVSLSSHKIFELEASNQMLQHRLDLKEEIEADIHLIETLKQEISLLQSQNEELLLKIEELEENEQILHQNWKVISEEESKQRQNLEEKIKMFQLLNQELKCKFQEEQENEFVAEHSLALELSLSDTSHDLESSSNVLKETISYLREQIRKKEEEIEILEEKLVKCHEDQEKLSETITEMEQTEKELRSRLTLYEKSAGTVDKIEYEDRIHELKSSQENLLIKLDTCSIQPHKIEREENSGNAEENNKTTDNAVSLNCGKNKNRFYSEQELGDITSEPGLQYISDAAFRQRCKVPENPLPDQNEELCVEISDVISPHESIQDEKNKLERKVDILVEAETKLMNRVVELEEIENTLTEELNDTKKLLFSKGLVTNSIENHEGSPCKLLSDANVATELLENYDPFAKSECRTVTGLFERSKSLEAENQALSDKLHNLVSAEFQVKQLSDKVKLLEQSEDKLMERVIELEEEEERLRMHLVKFQNRSTSIESEMTLEIEERNREIEQLKEENTMIHQKLYEYTEEIAILRKGRSRENKEKSSSDLESESLEVQDKKTDLNHKVNFACFIEKNGNEDMYLNNAGSELFRNLEKKLLTTQEKLEEVQTDYEMKLSDVEEYNKEIREKLEIQNREKGILEVENKALGKSNEKLCSELEFFQDLESELLIKQHQLMTRTAKFESKIKFLESHFQKENTVETKELEKAMNITIEENKSSSKIQNSLGNKLSEKEDKETENGEFKNTIWLLEELQNQNVEIERNIQGNEIGNLNLILSIEKLSKQNIENESKIYDLEKLISVLQKKNDEISLEKTACQMKLDAFYQELRTLKSKPCITGNENKSCQVNESEFDSGMSDCSTKSKLELAEMISLLKQKRNEEQNRVFQLSKKVEAFQNAVNQVTKVLTDEESMKTNKLTEIQGLPEAFLMKLGNLVEDNRDMKNCISPLQDTASSQRTGTMLLDTNEDILRESLMDVESYLRKQMSDLEHDCEELHQIARKDRDIIHDQNIYIKELELSEKQLKKQLNHLEVCEKTLYEKISDLEREQWKLEECLKTTQIHEIRLRELVNRYKLDEEIWLSKSNVLESHVHKLPPTENTLIEKMDLSEELETMKLRLKDIENEKTSLVESIKNYDYTVGDLNNQLSELELHKSNSQTQVSEMHRVNADLDHHFQEALEENCALSLHMAQLQQQKQDLECKLGISLSRETSLRQKLETLQQEQFNIHEQLDIHHSEDQQHRIQLMQKAGVNIKRNFVGLQRSENQLKFRVQELENSNSQRPLQNLCGHEAEIDILKQRLVRAHTALKKLQEAYFDKQGKKEFSEEMEQDDLHVQDYLHLISAEGKTVEKELYDGLKETKRVFYPEHMATEEVQSKYSCVNHFDTSNIDIAMEELQWKTIESYFPDDKDEHWARIAGATCLPSKHPESGREEEFVIGLTLSSETESAPISQNDTDSTLPSLENMSKSAHNFFRENSSSRPPPLPDSSPPLLEISKTTDSYVESFDVCSSEMVPENAKLTNTKDVKSGHKQICSSEMVPENEKLTNTKDVKSGHKQISRPVHSVDSFPDSGRDTSSIPSVSRQTVSVQDRIVQIQQQLQHYPSLMTRETDEEIGVFASENKINRLEKQLEEKNRYILNLELCIDNIKKILLEQVSTESHLANGIKRSIQQLQCKMEDTNNRSLELSCDPAVLHTELNRKELELASKRKEVERLMEELQQWQRECQTIEDMRSHALDSLHCLELEVDALQKAEKEMKYIKDEYNKVTKRNEALEEQCNEMELVALERDRIQDELDSLRMKINTAKKTEAENISLEERLNATTILLEERNEEMEETRKQALISITPLKVKVKKLVQSCKEKDELLQHLSSEVQNLKISKPLSLLEELGQLEASLTEEATTTQFHRSCDLEDVNSLSDATSCILRKSLENELATGNRFLSSSSLYVNDQKYASDSELSKEISTSTQHRSVSANILEKRHLDPPIDFQVDRIIGETSIMLSWTPPNLDDCNRNNGYIITGYKIFQNGKKCLEASSPHSRKGVITNVDLKSHHLFSIQTMSKEGEESDMTELLFKGVVVPQMSSQPVDNWLYENDEKRTFMGLYDYSPMQQSPHDYTKCEMNFRAGDPIMVYGHQRPDGFYYGEIHGKRGLVPGSFIEEIPSGFK